MLKLLNIFTDIHMYHYGDFCHVLFAFKHLLKNVVKH